MSYRTPKPSTTVIVDVKKCEHCGEEHSGLRFMQRSVAGQTHWSSCPNTGRVLTIRIEPLDDAAVPYYPDSDPRRTGGV